MALDAFSTHLGAAKCPLGQAVTPTHAAVAQTLGLGQTFPLKGGRESDSLSPFKKKVCPKPNVWATAVCVGVTAWLPPNGLKMHLSPGASQHVKSI